MNPGICLAASIWHYTFVMQIVWHSFSSQTTLAKYSTCLCEYAGSPGKTHYLMFLIVLKSECYCHMLLTCDKMIYAVAKLPILRNHGYSKTLWQEKLLKDSKRTLYTLPWFGWLDCCTHSYLSRMTSACNSQGMKNARTLWPPTPPLQPCIPKRNSEDSNKAGE